MSDTWVTDMQQFVEMYSPELHLLLADIRLGEFFGRIVTAATCWMPGIPMDSAVRCRRRPGRRPCKGHIKLFRAEVPPQISWRCTACDDNGVIRGWKGTQWDLSGPPRSEHPEVKLSVSPRDFRVVRGIPDLDHQAVRVVSAATTLESGEILLADSIWAMNHLAGFVAHAAGLEPRSSRRQALRRIGVRLETLLRARHVGVSRTGARSNDSDALLKMSETLLEFSRPALELVGDDAPEPLIREVLWVTVDIWNAMVLEQRGIEGDFVDRMRAILEKGVPSMVPVMDLLVERKRKLFPTDLRAIRDVEVFHDEGHRLAVRVIASMPEGVRC